MKIEIRMNGRIFLDLTPESELERLTLATMHASADKGKTVTLSLFGVSADGGVSVGIDK